MYKFLLASGVLGQSPEVQQHARRQYWNKRKLELKKERLKNEKAFSVQYTKEELKIISAAAALYGCSRTRYIKAAALAHCSKKQLIPDIEVMHQIKTLLSLNYTALRQVFEEHRTPRMVGIELLEQMERLSSTVSEFITPKSSHRDY